MMLYVQRQFLSSSLLNSFIYNYKKMYGALKNPTPAKSAKLQFHNEIKE